MVIQSRLNQHHFTELKALPHMCFMMICIFYYFHFRIFQRFQVLCFGTMGDGQFRRKEMKKMKQKLQHCNLCQGTFKFWTGLVHHVQDVHHGVICEKCGLSFRKEREMKAHICSTLILSFIVFLSLLSIRTEIGR